MSLLDQLQSTDFPGGETEIAEALFGLNHVSDRIAPLPPGARVLEIGSGSGILLGLLQERWPGLVYQGLEPFGDGFAYHSALNRFIRAQGIRIDAVRYEDITPDAPYDIIFSVNVFEHVADWRQYIDFVEHNLTADGVAMILCPNYGFPYESHFCLPLIGNKALTYRLFRKRIERHEREEDFAGLWTSLNMVRLGAVKRHLRGTGLELTVNHAVMDDMIARMTSDPSFRQRQRIVGGIGQVLHRIGALRPLKWRLFENFMPYMQLELRHRRG